MPARTGSPSASAKDALVHEMLERVADKWTLLVIDALDSWKTMRFSRLREELGGVSQKMLTKTLRQLERDGLVVAGSAGREGCPDDHRDGSHRTHRRPNRRAPARIG
jgi:hypothetical protein